MPTRPRPPWRRRSRPRSSSSSPTRRASSGTGTNPSSLISGLTPEECRDLIAQGVIDKGMIPKVEACLTSLEAGVRKTHIIDGRLRHSLLLEIFTESGVGTEIVNDDHPDSRLPQGRRPVLVR